MANYDSFTQALAAGRVGEQLTIRYLTAIGYEIEDVSKNKEYFAKDIDLIARKGNESMAVEVKTCSKLSQYGNVIIETLTNVAAGKDGWFITSKASHIFFVCPVTKTIHCVRLDELRQLFKEKKKQYRRLITHQKECGKYYKEGEIYLIPVDDLKTLPHYVRLDSNIISKYQKKEK